MKNIENMLVRELLVLAKELSIRGRWRMNNKELKRAIIIRQEQRKADNGKDLRDSVRDILTQQVFEGNRKWSCISFGLLIDKKIQEYSDVCFYSLNIGSMDKSREGFCLLVKESAEYELGGKLKAHKPYLIESFDYLLNRSPFRECYITKDPEEAFEKGILFNVDRPYSDVVTSAVAIRSMFEFPYISRGFSLLKEKLKFIANEDENHGFIDPIEHVLYLVANMVQIIPGREKYIPNSLGKGHDLFCKHQNIDEILRTFKYGLFLNEGEPSFREQQFRSFKIFNSTGTQFNSPTIDEVVYANPKIFKVEGEGWNRNSYLKQEDVPYLINFLLNRMIGIQPLRDI